MEELPPLVVAYNESHLPEPYTHAAKGILILYLLIALFCDYVTHPAENILT